MSLEHILYCIGLALVLLYLMMGLDDFIWDLTTMMLRPSYKKQRLNLQQLSQIPPKLLAVAVAAWHEDNVLGDVIDNIVESTDYPKSMYHIFLGVYPNDLATVRVAKELAERHDNVHVIINELPGPTSKAQNINYVIQRISAFEQKNGWEFASLTIHDSEDVVHPYELRVTNYLLDTHDALQFPVFPLMRMPTFRNYFKTITTGTYADEFAENHFTTMVSRYMAGAFVPSAGTGFVLSRKTLQSFGGEDVLPRTSLTEDYRLSLTLFERGIRMYYVLEQAPRINDKGKLMWDFIATRSIFPNTFKTATKQKTRWIYGITMQSFRLRGIFKNKKMSIAGRYSLYKDNKAKVGNLLAMVGYPILIYFLASLFIPLPAIYPKGTLSWYLSFAVTVMMLERQVFRGVAIYHVYGMRSVFFACLLPPILPLRLIWGNIINMVATVRAYKQKWFGTPSPIKDKKKGAKTAIEKTKDKQIAWAKTDHAFLEKSVLLRYQRTLGDILLERGYVSPGELQNTLKIAAENGERIGACLRKQGIITEEQLLDALSSVKHIPYVQPALIESFNLSQFALDFNQTLLKQLKALPIMRIDGGYVFAFCDDSPENAQTTLRLTYDIQVQVVFTMRGAIEDGLNIMYNTDIPAYDANTPAVQLFSDGRINYEQVILVRNYSLLLEKTEEDILRSIGLLRRLQVPHKEMAVIC